MKQSQRLSSLSLILISVPPWHLQTHPSQISGCPFSHGMRLPDRNWGCKLTHSPRLLHQLIAREGRRAGVIRKEPERVWTCEWYIKVWPVISRFVISDLFNDLWVTQRLDCMEGCSRTQHWICQIFCQIERPRDNSAPSVVWKIPAPSHQLINLSHHLPIQGALEGCYSTSTIIWQSEKQLHNYSLMAKSFSSRCKGFAWSNMNTVHFIQYFVNWCAKLS